MQNSLPSTLLNNPFTYKKNNFLRHISAKYTASHEKFLQNATNSIPVSSYGIKGTKHLQKIYKDTFEIKRARNEKSIFFRPYTAPSKEHILLNQHLLKTQDFKEILRDRQIKTVEVNPLDALYFEDISLSKHNNNNEFFKINNEALSTKKNNLLKIYDQKEILNVSKTNDFLKSSPNNREKKESAFDFMTSIDAKEHISHKFPARPQSSQIRKRKTSINSYKKEKNVQKDLTNGFFDVKNQRFVRNKILQTPAILLDIVRKIDYETVNSNKSFTNLMINSIQNQRIFHNIRHKKIPIENRGFYSKTLQINIENDRKSSKINVSKLAKI